MKEPFRVEPLAGGGVVLSAREDVTIGWGWLVLLALVASPFATWAFFRVTHRPAGMATLAMGFFAVVMLVAIVGELLAAERIEMRADALRFTKRRTIVDVPRADVTRVVLHVVTSTNTFVALLTKEDEDAEDPPSWGLGMFAHRRRSTQERLVQWLEAWRSTGSTSPPPADAPVPIRTEAEIRW